MKSIHRQLPLVAVAPGLVVALLGAASASAQKSQEPAQASAATQHFEALKRTGREHITLERALAIGDFGRDLVYTPVTPCRIVDTRIAGGMLAAGSTRTYDVDGADFVAQGGASGSCGVPLGVATAVTMTLTVTGGAQPGYLTAWGFGAQPHSSVLNYESGQTIANTSIIPVAPGSGVDFSLFAAGATHVIVDVVGFFAAPLSTPLACTNVASAVTAVPHNVYTAVDANCPAGYRVTGGGTFPTEGTLGRPHIWTDGSPTAGSGNGWRTWVNNQTGGSRTMQSYAVCCRVPGR